MQHGALDFAGASRSILAVALAGRPAVVRVPVGEFPTASRLLDAGAAGVIAPMINGRADAERFAAFAKFLPVGERLIPIRAVRAISSPRHAAPQHKKDRRGNCSKPVIRG